MDEVIAICIGSTPNGPGTVQQRLWVVTPEIADQVAAMLDSMGFEKLSGLVDAVKASEFANQNMIVDEF